MFNPERDWAWKGPPSPARKTEVIEPAFASRAQAVFFLSVVLLALALPALIDRTGAISREDSYDLMPAQHGAFGFVREEIFDVEDDIDLLFVGSSVLFAGIDTPEVKKELSHSLGREARVLTFGHYFNSFDIAYMQVRDVLERRRVRMLVLSVPRVPYSEGPSPIAHWFMRYSEAGEVMANMPARDHAALYAGTVLRSPRDLLSLVRRERRVQNRWEENLGADLAELGMGRSPDDFVRFTPEPPAIPADAMIYSPRSRDRFTFTGEPLTPYQYQYFKSLVELAHKNGVPVAIVNIPQKPEARRPNVVGRLNWAEALSLDIPLIGVQPALLFSKLDDNQIEALYFDNAHLNANGSKLYTRTVLPAIIEVYKQRAKQD